MASGNLPATAGNINPSTKSFGELKGIVASIVGAKSQPDEVEAGTCIHRALDWIQNHDWESMLVQGSAITTVAGTSEYVLGPRHRKVHSMRVVSGSERKIHFIRKGELDRMVSHQSPRGLPTHYTMYRQGQAGVLQLWRTPDTAESLQYSWYKDFAKPTDDGASIDPNFPTEWEHMLITYAQFLCGLTRGVRSERLEMLKREAEMAKREALMRDSNEFDEDIVMMPDDGSNAMGAPFTGFDDPSRWG